MPKLFQMLKQVNTIRSNLICFGVLINSCLDFHFLLITRFTRVLEVVLKVLIVAILYNANTCAKAFSYYKLSSINFQGSSASLKQEVYTP